MAIRYIRKHLWRLRTFSTRLLCSCSCPRCTSHAFWVSLWTRDCPRSLLCIPNDPTLKLEPFFFLLFVFWIFFPRDSSSPLSSIILDFVCAYLPNTLSFFFFSIFFKFILISSFTSLLIYSLFLIFNK